MSSTAGIAAFAAFVVICGLVSLIVVLSSREIEPSARVPSVDCAVLEKRKFLSSSFAAPSRLGNHIFELAAILGISRTLKRQPVFWIEDVVYRKMLEDTRRILPGLIDEFTVIEGKIQSDVKMIAFPAKSRIFESPMRFVEVPDAFLHLSGHFYQSWKYFAGGRDEMRRLLAPKKTFKGLPVSNETNFVTCVHTRRGDFKSVGFYPSDANFVRKAVEFMERRQKHKTHLRTHVVVFGDDVDFMKALFPDTVTSDVWERDVKPTTKHFVSKNSPADDLLYSSQHCDTVLISAPVSTFGWWIGYLSKGDDVFYLDVRTVNDSLYKSGRLKLDDYFPPKWTMLKTSNDANASVVETSF